MADNVTVANGGSGSNFTAATDEVAVNGGSSGHVQFMKLVDGTSNGTEGLPGSLARGLMVDAGPSTFRIEVNSAGLTTSTTAYTSGDQLGTELTFASCARVSGQGGVIVGAVLLDKPKVLSATPADVDLLLFSSSITGAADNAAFDDSDTDMGELVAKIRFSLADWVSMSSNAFNQQQNLAIGYTCDATSLFGILVSRTNHTFFGAVTDLRVALTVVRD